MRARVRFAPAVLCAVGALFLSTSASAQMRMTIEDLDRGLRAAESGGEIPLSNRPMPKMRSMNDRLFDHPATGEVESYSLPSEFGVILEYEGGRVALEASGVRVVSQVGNIYTARMTKDEIGNLRKVAGLKSARLARYTRPHLNVSRVDVNAVAENAGVGTPPVYNGRAGRGMIIGDVDSGIDWTRPDFSDSLGKTRILYIWDQNDNIGPGPAGFGYGSEFTKAQIDNTPGSVRQTDSDGHGTAVAGVLIGNGSQTGCSQPAYRYVGIAPLANFIEVKTDFSDAGIIDGVNYIFQKAAALGKDAVVNLSLGSQYGPHDGSDTFGTAISGLTGPGKIVVASSGNDQEDKIHGKLITTSQTPGTDKFTFSVPSYTRNVGTFNDYILITGWYDPTASYSIRLRGPLASDTLSCGFNNSRDRQITGTGKCFISNQHALFGYSGTSKGRQFEIEIYDSIATSNPKVGTWTIEVTSNNATSVGKRVDMWIYAEQLGAAGVLAPVVTGLDNTTMCGSPADGDSVFAVGAHATKGSWASCAQGGTCAYVVPPTLNAIASFSNVGPRRDGVQKPEITAPGFGVATTHSNQAGAIGVCGDVDDGVHEVEAGTSFSAPHVAAAASLFLSAYPGSSPSRVKQAFEAHARTDAFTGAVPNLTWGYGKLDIYSTFDHQGPTVAITAPNGGESWLEGSTQNITWNASDFSGVANVDLLLSTDGGGVYGTTIASAIPNTGSYSWLVPNGATTIARVRVTARDTWGNFASASSAANFAITSSVDGVPPTITLNSPGTLEAGVPANVSFTAGDNVGVTGVDLEYSNNNGGSWFPVVSGLTSSPFLWNVPAAIVAQAKLRATAHDAALNQAQDTAGPFQIVDTTPPSLTLVSPNGGEAWTEGESRLIDWSSADLVGVDSVRVEYSLTGSGGPWTTAATVAPDTTGYLWTVPGAATDSAIVRVTAYDPALNSTVDLSNALFSIGRPVGIDAPGALSFALLVPNPNPGSGATTLRFRLPSPSDATLEIYTPNGQRVWTSGAASFAAGEHSVRWNGRDASGARARAGLYFVRLTTAMGTKKVKMIRL